MRGLRDTIVAWVDQRLRDMLAAPRMWGSDEAIEMQALQLVELRALALQPAEEIENPGRIIDAYTEYLNARFPHTPNRPLFKIVSTDEVGRNVADEFNRFLQAFLPTMLEENPFQHSQIALRLRFHRDQMPTAASVTGYYQEFTRAARAATRRRGVTTGRAGKGVDVATDFELSDVRITPKNGGPAEVTVLLGGGVGQHDMWSDDQVHEALSGMVMLGEWADSHAEVRALPVDNVALRTRLALQTMRILPRGNVETVEIGGRLVGRQRPVVFRADYHRRLVEVVGEATPSQPFDERGDIRAIDWDRGYIVLGLGKKRLTCYVPPFQLPEAVTVGEPARVVGRLYTPIAGKPFVLGEQLEVSLQPGDDDRDA